MQTIVLIVKYVVPKSALATPKKLSKMLSKSQHWQFQKNCPRCCPIVVGKAIQHWKLQKNVQDTVH